MSKKSPTRLEKLMKLPMAADLESLVVSYGFLNHDADAPAEFIDPINRGIRAVVAEMPGDAAQIFTEIMAQFPTDEADLTKRVSALKGTWNKYKLDGHPADYTDREIFRLFKPSIAKAVEMRAMMSHIAKEAGITWPEISSSTRPARVRMPSIIFASPQVVN
jgi:hypothetical protein